MRSRGVAIRFSRSILSVSWDLNIFFMGFNYGFIYIYIYCMFLCLKIRAAGWLTNRCNRFLWRARVESAIIGFLGPGLDMACKNHRSCISIYLPIYLPITYIYIYYIYIIYYIYYIIYIYYILYILYLLYILYIKIYIHIHFHFEVSFLVLVRQLIEGTFCRKPWVTPTRNFPFNIPETLPIWSMSTSNCSERNKT